jgi:glutathione S-transferase
MAVFVSQHIMPAATNLALRLRARVLGIAPDEAAIARGEKALPDPIAVIEGQLANKSWLLGTEFSLVDCAYCPVFDLLERAGFSFGAFPRVGAYLDAARVRPAWQKTPKLPGL